MHWILPWGQYSSGVRRQGRPRLLLEGEPVVAPAVLRQRPSPSQQIAAVEFPVCGDAAAAAQAEPPCVDAPEQVVPLLGVDAQGGADVVAGAFGLVEVVQKHGTRSPYGTRLFSVPERRGRVPRRRGQARPVLATPRAPSAPVGDQQGDAGAGAVHLLPRHAQEVGLGDVVLEDDQDGGPDAVVVGGPVR